MPFELIRRKEGEFSEKQEIRHSNVQVSINDWGHLCVREFDNNKREYFCEEYKQFVNYSTNPPEKLCGRQFCNCCKNLIEKVVAGEEHLIVFDKSTTKRILRFIEDLAQRGFPF